MTIWDQIRYAVGIHKQARVDAGRHLAVDHSYERLSGGYRAAADRGAKIARP